MKLYLILALCAMAAAAPGLKKGQELVVPSPVSLIEESLGQERNILINTLVRQLIAYLRNIINNGSDIFGIPPLDPLEVDHYHLYMPAGLLNIDLVLKDILATGFGRFVVNTSLLNLSTMTFDVDISMPRVDISAEEYDMVGNLYSAIPLYGKGKAKFVVENFRFGGRLFLKQSEDEQSILIDRIENPFFEIPSLKADLTGVIGGGDIDAVVNAVIEDVIVNYINRFQAIIASFSSSALVTFGNPLLDQLDTWKYISPLIPRSTHQ